MSTPVFRNGRAADIPAILDLIAGGAPVPDDSPPPDPSHPNYLAAFEAIEADPNQILLVAERDEEIIGTLQITFIPGFINVGRWRGQLESVHIRKDQRGNGIGAAMIEHAKNICCDRGCAIIQLTTNKVRIDAHRFYERLGFQATHEGFKYTTK